MKKSTSAAIAYHLNLLLLLYEIQGIGYYVTSSIVTGQPFIHDCKYFTTISNILAGISAACILPCQFRRLKGEDVVPSTAVSVIKLVGTAAVALTLTVVMGYIAPFIGGYRNALRGGNSFLLHGLCPVLAIVSFVFFDGGTPITKKQGWPALIVGAVYFSLYFILNILHVNGWGDFYNFNHFGNWPVIFVLLLLVNYLLVKVLRLGHNKFCDHCENHPKM